MNLINLSKLGTAFLNQNLPFQADVYVFCLDVVHIQVTVVIYFVYDLILNRNDGDDV